VEPSNPQSRKLPNTSHDRPARMVRNGRPEDPIFNAEEILFRRYAKEHFEGDKIVAAFFNFPPSFNRQKYSEPEDVIFSDDGQFDGWGVLEYRVDQATLGLEHQSGAFSFFPRHVPEETNYSHTEVRCKALSDGEREVFPSQSIRKLYRTRLSQQIPTVRILALR
jgi:hypothetical protein